MTEFLTAGVRALEKAGAGFSDVRVEDRTAFAVRIVNERIQTANQVRRRGWGVRAFVDGAWGYASGTSSEASAVVEAAKKATAIARGNAASGVPKSKLRKLPVTRKTLTSKPKADPRDVSGEEKIAAAMEVCRAQRRDGVSSTNSQYADTDFRFQISNTWRARLSWREVRVRIAGQAVAGNGFRRAVATVEGACTRPAETHLSYFVVEPGTKTTDALLADVDRGVYVEKFASPEVNPFSGSFALEVRNATLIENGDLTDHVKLALLTGNFYEGLKNIVGIGREPAASHAFLTMPGCAYVPPIAFEGFELVGQT